MQITSIIYICNNAMWSITNRTIKRVVVFFPSWCFVYLRTYSRTVLFNKITMTDLNNGEVREGISGCKWKVGARFSPIWDHFIKGDSAGSGHHQATCKYCNCFLNKEDHNIFVHISFHFVLMHMKMQNVQLTKNF